MESTTGETDRKRRHFSSISPTAATAKKPQFVPLSEDKKLDAAVLQYQNQKLSQKLESQKVEYDYIKQKFSELKKRQEPYDITLSVVNESWNKLVDNLQSYSVRIRETSRGGEDASHISSTESRSLSSHEDAFLSRLSETGATESSSTNNCHNQPEETISTPSEKTKSILGNIVVAIDDLWKLKERLSAALKSLPEDGSCSTMVSSDIEAEIKNLRLAFSDIHLRHKLLATDIQKHRDTDAKNKAEFKRLKGEFEATVAELEESNIKLAALKSERDATNGAFFPVLNFASKPLSGDKMGDIQKDLQDMESALKELLDQASSRALQLKELHEERIRILKQLSMLQNNLKSVKYISSSQSYLSVREQLAKSKEEVANYQTILEKLQVDKDTMAWREKEVNIKNDLADVFSRSSSVAECKMNELRMEIQRQIDQRCSIETKLAEASIEPGRKEIITEFKALVSSFPEDMSSMQHQLNKYKETASDVHSLRADVQSLSSVLDRKAKEIDTLSARSTNQAAELSRLQNMTQEIKQSDQELRLLLEMYRRESIDPRDIMEARDSEYMAWAFVQSMKSSLDEQNLEMRVKTANEAEATAQQRLATAEAEIADLRQKLEPSKRDMSRLSDDLKSKQEENEAYLSEIESIGQAYDDMQTQNQQLLHQIMERDDYNIKLVVEGLKARQLHDALYMGKKIMENEINQASASLDIYNMKAARIDDQLNMCSDQVQKLTEDKLQTLFTLENTRKRLLDVNKLAQHTRDSLEESISKLDMNRPSLSEMQIELERERFKRKRVEEELEGSRRKVSRLKEQMEGTSVIGKLKEELREYREVLKCSICLDRPKEVVITKCCHLFCNPCVQKIIKSRHRKCPTCATTFGANDIKPVYI